MAHYLAVGGYLLWRYYYVLEYGYSAVYYTNAARRVLVHALTGDDPGPEEDISEDWVLCEDAESPTVILNK
jgi:hypothetical protein